MRTRFFTAALACAALALPATALGKGASEVKIEGEGIDGGAIVFSTGTGGDAPPGTTMARLAEGSGFYPAVFGQSPNPLEPGRPKGDLGPKYVASYVMPSPNGEGVVRQELYPYAEGGMVTYVAPGQPIFGEGDDMRTQGGWFRAYDDVKQLLVDAGLPATRPTGGASGGTDIPWPALTGAGVLALGLAAAAWLVLRRRPHPATAR